MLTIIEFNQREQIKSIYDQFDPLHSTWIVSDLKSKLEIQNNILAKGNSYHDESVLRIGDLWQKILNRKYPEIKIVTEDYAKVLILDFLSKHQGALDVNDKNIKSIFSYIELFSSILFHAQGKSQLGEWFNQNIDSAFRWKKWFLISQLCVNYLVEQHKVICRPWIASFLQNEIQLHQFWHRKLFIDLGSELTKVEALLIKQLQMSNEVIVMNPVPAWESQFKQIKLSYSDLYQQANQVIVMPQISFDHIKKIDQLRFSGMLSEVKHVVAQVRSWLEQGVQLKNIALISSQIEIYWPILSKYFEYEGIPIQKDRTTRMVSFPNVAQWFSLLKLMDVEKFEYHDLEKVYFQSFEKYQDPIRFEKFHSQFAEIFSLQEASMNQLSDVVSIDFKNKQDYFSRDQFIDLAISQWKDSDVEHLQIIVQEIFSMTSSAVQFRLCNWIEWVQQIILKKEVKLQQAPIEGVQLIKIQAANSLEYQYRIFLNLSDESIKKTGLVHLNKDDYFNLNKDLGFNLQNPELSQIEYELRLISEMSSPVHDQYCFSQTDFDGQLLTPSQFWMQFGDCHNLTVPNMTRLDELQHLRTPNVKANHQQVENEINKIVNQKMRWLKKVSYSATSLSDYYQCPFIFAAKKYFYLEDHAQIDLDADARTHGVLVHKIFEKILMTQLIQTLSTEQMTELVRQSFTECDFKTTSDVITQLYVKKYVKIVQKFIQFENSWRQKYSSFKTVGCEVTFSFYLNLTTLEVRKAEISQIQPKQDEIFFSGKIDRIDLVDQKYIVVYDYKSSTDKAHQFGSWVKHNEFQLLIYLLVIYHELIDDYVGKQIGGAFLYNFRKFDFKFGILKNDLQDRIGFGKKSFNEVNQETFYSLIQELKLKIQQAAENIKSGELQPRPKDLSICLNCQWSRVCRVSHLN